MNDLTQPVYYVSYPEYLDFYRMGSTSNTSDHCLQLISQQVQSLQESHRILAFRLETSENEREALRQQNVLLRQQLQEKAPRAKRRYRKRQTSIDKKIFACRIDDCMNRYSSKIALNAHRRKKHKN